MFDSSRGEKTSKTIDQNEKESPIHSRKGSRFFAALNQNNKAKVKEM